MKKTSLTVAVLAASSLCVVTTAYAKDRNHAIEAGATFIGDQELATFGYSYEVANNIVVGGGFMLGTQAIDGLPSPNSQDAWGLYSNVGYKFEVAEFDIIPKIGINYFNADVQFEDQASSDINIDNVYASVGATVNWRMIGMTVDYGQINDSAKIPDGSGGYQSFEEDVVRVTASFNF
ncbi:hypothetical protein L4D13_06330 [Photobacterium profundum]|uniref:hypothetical protein n=1 Tax=Photobacterium profundum TaxID=74109 RepID=UPI003D0CAE31